MGEFAERYGPWAVITGASAGIGAEYARRIAERGIHVVLVARRRQRLEELAAIIEDACGVEVRVAPVDLASRDPMRVLQPVIEDLEIGLLVHCAGFGSSGPFLDMDLHVQESMINLNCRAPALLTHELAQGMRDRGRGGIVVVSSVNAFCAARGMANYNATKAYDLLFAEGLASELAPYGVDVQALCPGGTRTEFQQVAGLEPRRFGPFAALIFSSPSHVVRASMKKMGRRVTVIPGVVNKLTVIAMTLLPRWLSRRMFGMVMDRFSASH